MTNNKYASHRKIFIPELNESLCEPRHRLAELQQKYDLPERRRCFAVSNTCFCGQDFSEIEYSRLERAKAMALELRSSLQN